MSRNYHGYSANETQTRQNNGLQMLHSSHMTTEQQQPLEQYHTASQFGYAGHIQPEPIHRGGKDMQTQISHVAFSSQSEAITQNSYAQNNFETGKMEGEESQLLLCSETFSSPTPPSDDSGWTQTGSSIVWTHSNTHSLVNGTTQAQQYNQSENEGCESYTPLDNNINSYSVIDISNSNTGEISANSENITRPKDHLLKAALLGGIVSSEKLYPIALEKDINSNFQAKCSNGRPKFVGNDGDTCRRMSGTNGFDRNRMTGSSSGGSNNNLSRLADGAGSQGQPQPQVTSAAEGMLMGRVGNTGGVALHDANTRSIVAGTAGAGPQATIGSIFRPPQSLAADTARYAATAYTTSAGSSTAVGPFSPLHTSHAPGLAPYSAFYNQYPSYSGSVMHGTLDPQFGSYSAVLQSMGTQAAQSQVPRSPFGSATGGAGALAQYPMLSVTQTSLQGTGKSYLPQNSQNLSTVHEHDELKYRREQELELQRRHSTTGVIKDEKSHYFSVPSSFTEPSRASVSSVMRESPSQKRELVAPSVQDYYKVPSGREGSLKHRILRPSDSSSVSIGNPQHSAFINTDEPSPKRTKFTVPDSDREPNKSGLGDSGQSTGTEQHSGVSRSSTSTHLHYPQHFVKGSIIQLASGDLKRVEDLETDDFVNSADISSDLKIDSSTVVHIEENRALGTAVLGFVVGEHKVQVTVEAAVEHPFFVFGQGWSSCEPSWTLKRYGLDCHRLTVGDVCISLTHREVTAHAAEISQQQKQQNRLEGNFIFNKQLKNESSPRGSPRQQRIKSPSHSVQSPSSSFNTQGQAVYRSEIGQNESSAHVKDEHSFVTPASTQISTNSQTQEQEMHPSTAS